MKKLIAALAVVAFAVAAQAELLATWSNLGKAQTGAEGIVGDGDIGVAGYTYYDSGSTVDAGVLGVKDMVYYSSGSPILSSANGDPLVRINAGEGKGVEFDYDVASGYEVTQSTLSTYFRGTGGSPDSYQVLVNGTKVGNSYAPTETSTLTSFGLGTLSGNGTVALVADSSTKINGKTGAASGNMEFAQSIDLEGNVREATSVPEPATMSLLGLGALAMVIRRKLRK